MKVPWARIERLMNVGGLTWEQAADAFGCTTAAMAQWKTGKTGLAPKTLYKLEQLEERLGIRPTKSIVREETPGEYVTSSLAAEMRRDLRDMKRDLAAMDKRVNEMIKRLDGE